MQRDNLPNPQVVFQAPLCIFVQPGAVSAGPELALSGANFGASESATGK